jgi:hypothetical protein
MATRKLSRLKQMEEVIRMLGSQLVIFQPTGYVSMKPGSVLLLYRDQRRHPWGGIGDLIADLTFQVQTRH